MLRNRLTPNQAWEKIKYYCAWQERSHQEVKDKLYGFGLATDDVDRLIAQLIEENYLNEQRFAIQFAGGKFRLKKWGRIKINNELRAKRVSPYNIKVAIGSIPESDYIDLLDALTVAKWDALKQEQYINRQAKTMRYLLQKGFEADLIRVALNKVRGKNEDFK